MLVGILQGLLHVGIAQAAPRGGEVVLGVGEISLNGAQTDILQSTERLAIDWRAFNVSAGERVVFTQPSVNAMVLNRDFSGSPSQIFGSISANGQVFLLNTAGMLIGPSASVDVGGLFLSDMMTDLEGFESGRLQLMDADTNRGGIRNQGMLTVHGDQGLYMVGQFVDNQGSIITESGDIHLAVADRAIVTLGDSGMLGIELPQPLVKTVAGTDTLILNGGTIIAHDGNVYMDARYNAALQTDAINNQGIVNAVAITEGNGRIFLTARPEDMSPLEEARDNIPYDDPSDDGQVVVRDLEKAPPSTLDGALADCQPTPETEQDCRKKNALKRFLSRLLVNGALPD